MKEHEEELFVNLPLCKNGAKARSVIEAAQFTSSYCLSAICPCAIVINPSMPTKLQTGLNATAQAMTQVVALPLGEGSSTNEYAQQHIEVRSNDWKCHISLFIVLNLAYCNLQLILKSTVSNYCHASVTKSLIPHFSD